MRFLSVHLRPLVLATLVAVLLAAVAGGQEPQAKTTTIAAHERTVLGIAFSPDGKSIWTAGEDGATKRWSLAEKKVIQHLGEPRERVNAVAISRDGKTIATGGRGKLTVWNAETGQEKFSLAPAQSVVNVDLSPDGRYLAAAYYQTDHTAVIDTASGKEVAKLAEPARVGLTPERSDGRPIGAVAWSPDGKYLAACNAPPFFASIVSLYDARTFKLRSQFVAHPHNRSYCLAFSADGTLLACGTQDAQVKVFDVAAVIAAWQDREKAVAAVDATVAATAAKLVARLGSENFQQREAASRELARLGRPAIEPLKKAIAESADAEVRSRAQALANRLADAVEGPLNAIVPIHTLSTARIGSVRSLAFSPDGNLLAVGIMKLNTANGQLELWRLDQPQRPVTVVEDQPVNWLAFSPDGKWVASGLTGGNMLLLEVHVPD
jgi:WD40 repeat protein